MHRVKAVQRPETGPHHHPATTQHGLSSPHGAPPPSSDQAFRGQWGGAFQGPISGGLYKAHQDKVMPGVLSKSLPAPSASSPSVTGSSTQHSHSGGFVPRPVRKARSETDLRESDFEKQIKVSCMCASERRWPSVSLYSLLYCKTLCTSCFQGSILCVVWYIRHSNPQFDVTFETTVII